MNYAPIFVFVHRIDGAAAAAARPKERSKKKTMRREREREKKKASATAKRQRQRIISALTFSSPILEEIRNNILKPNPGSKMKPRVPLIVLCHGICSEVKELLNNGVLPINASLMKRSDPSVVGAVWFGARRRQQYDYVQHSPACCPNKARVSALVGQINISTSIDKLLNARFVGRIARMVERRHSSVALKVDLGPALNQVGNNFIVAIPASPNKRRAPSGVRIVNVHSGGFLRIFFRIGGLPGGGSVEGLSGVRRNHESERAIGRFCGDGRQR